MPTYPQTTYFHVGPFRLYRHDIGDYMHRWLLTLPGGKMLRLHHILRSDAGRDFHDHPFDFTSFLLTGGYFEYKPITEYPSGKKHKFRLWWPRFSIVRKQAEDLHSLELTKPVWTLVLTGPRRRVWGFQTPTGWVPWTEYEGEA